MIRFIVFVIAKYYCAGIFWGWFPYTAVQIDMQEILRRGPVAYGTLFNLQPTSTPTPIPRKVK